MLAVLEIWAEYESHMSNGHPLCTKYVLVRCDPSIQRFLRVPYFSGLVPFDSYFDLLKKHSIFYTSQVRESRYCHSDYLSYRNSMENLVRTETISDVECVCALINECTRHVDRNKDVLSWVRDISKSAFDTVSHRTVTSLTLTFRLARANAERN